MLLWSLILTLSLGLAKTTILPVSFDDDCSQVQCPTETSQCPQDSVERQPSPVVEMLFDPDEYMPPHEFYDEADDPADVIEQHFDELPVQLSAFTIPPNISTPTISNSTTNTTTNQLTDNVDLKVSKAEEDIESILVKRELSFDNEKFDAIDEHAHQLHICCDTAVNRRRRRRRSTVQDDCECKPCDPIPQCPTGEVAFRQNEAAGTPGDCCPRYACAPKPECGKNGESKPYWRDSCTRCSCYGSNGVELCHNECPEMEEQETRHSCYSVYLQEPMLHGSEWFENDYCTKCRCENGERECVESLCKPVTCNNPVKVSGQCCPQCSESDENILISHENTTYSSISSTPAQEVMNEMTTGGGATVSSITESVATENTTAFTSTTSSAVQTSNDSTTELTGFQNQSTSTGTTTTLLIDSSSSTTSAVYSNSTEVFSTTNRIDDIAAVAYFGPMMYNSPTEDSSTSTEQTINETTESTSQSSNASQAYTSPPTLSSEEETTATSTTTTADVTETSTEQSLPSTESTRDLCTTSTLASEDSTMARFISSLETQTETKATSSISESSTHINFKSNESTTPRLDSTTRFTAATSTTGSTASSIATDSSSTDTSSSTTSSPYLNTATTPATPTSTSTTNSPYTSTSPTQAATTIVYWYTFSTSAPSPPIPQPTIYQPSVRSFFTRPEVRYIGATFFVASLAICALAVWKFCMPTRGTRLKNHYRTVPSSEATSLSHSPTTSHSSMA